MSPIISNVNTISNVIDEIAIGGGLDPDALAFIIATGITDPTEKSAINALVIDLKNGGLWTKLQALYPIVGGTATTHKYNLKDPQDLDTSFRLTFSGGWTHAATGMTPNGTTGFADTHFNPNVDLVLYTSGTIGVYSRTANATDGVDIGCADTPADLYIRPASITHTFIYGRHSNDTMVDTITTDGFISLTRGTSTSLNCYQAGLSLLPTNTSLMWSGVLINYNIYLGARNAGGSADLFSDRELAFGVIGPRLTTGEHLDLYNTIQTYQTTLSRQV